MAEGVRLTGLCRLRSLPEFARTIFPGSEITNLFDFQRLLVAELIREWSGFRAHMSTTGAALLTWMLVRFQVENLKVLVRVHLAEAPGGDRQPYLLPLPRDLALDVRGLSGAQSLDEFIGLTPKGVLRKSLDQRVRIAPGHTRPFFLEAALDHGYFEELLARVDGLSQDREIVRPLACQEVDIFHLMLVTRGKFHYGLARETLMPLHVPGTRVPVALFETMLDDQDVSTSVNRVVGRTLDAEPVERRSGADAACAFDGAVVERLAWTRFLRLANLAFRRSHMGLGAVIGYTGIRRMEVANLITISEGIQKGVAPESLRARLIPVTGG